MRLVRRDKEQAIAIYRKVLEIDERNLLAMNNLAALLSEVATTRSEALLIIERAIAVAEERDVSPTVEALLSDTMGSVLLFQGRPQESLPFFENATNLKSGEAIYHLHLAAASHRVGLTAKALENFQIAQNLGVNQLILSRLDKDLVGDLTSLEHQQTNLNL